MAGRSGTEMIPVVQKSRERQHSLISDPNWIRKMEAKLAPLGEVDTEATRIFQAYELPDQNQKTHYHNGSTVFVSRGLVDPEEYVRKISKFHEAINLVDQDRQFDIDKGNYDRKTNEPYMYTSLEVIIGNQDYPELCYRYRVFNIEPTNDPTVFVITVLPNIEYEKEKSVYIPYKEPNTMDTPEQNDDSSELVITDESGFDSSVYKFANNSELSKIIGFTRETGNVLMHQRFPLNKREYITRVNLTVDTKQTSVWAVTRNGDAVDKYANSLYDKS